MSENIIREREQLAGGHQAIRKELNKLLEYGNIDVPMLPEHAARVVSMANRPDCDVQMLARMIEFDQSLAARVMKVARSAAYESSSPINSLQHAISWLGMGEISDIAFTAAAQGRLLNVPGQRPRAVHMWKVAVAAAIWSREIAAIARRYSEITYLCGLLHDIGKPIALMATADLAGKLGVRLTDEDYEVLINEYHGPLGAVLAEKWRLPEAVAVCIRCWPDWTTAQEYAEEVPVVHLAHHLAELVLEQGPSIARETLADSPVLEALNIGPDRFKGLLDRARWVMDQVHAY
jgi:HD-like signal output (HDOD) protein